MRLYCPICDKLTPHQQAHKANKSGLLCSCGRFQPVNKINRKDMARPRGGLTNSKRFQKPEVENTNPLQVVGGIASGIGQATQSVANAVQATTNGLHAVNNGLKSVKQAFNGGSSLVTDNAKSALDQALKVGNQYGIEQINLSEFITGNPYQASDSIPEMKAADANREKLKIQRQNNALDVRLERIKQNRKITTIATEERRLLGDLVDFETVGIETATKVVKNQIADTRYRIEQSKLEQTEEQLQQQQIATQGTLNLTEGIRLEWQLKLENQQAKNDRLRLDIEGAIKDNDRRREELEARLLEA
ncbi:hypothetical protein NIES22_73850 (plasmid) [Calothrix brevissima NIES-22]|nr:hypothetical protein NIES22_73850 [Calothrix brevissima NIES-22]